VSAAPTPGAGEVLRPVAADVRSATHAGRYLTWLEEREGRRFADYTELWRWSVAELEAFWSSLAERFEVIFHAPAERVLSGHAMPGARWFPGARLNYAEHALRTTGDRVMAVSVSQTRARQQLTADELREQVARARSGLRRLGVGRGDRVAAYLPNATEALVSFLACASLGAIFSSCAPEFGVRSVVDRLRQVEPKVLLAIDGYRYGSKAIDCRARVAEIRAALPSVETVVGVPYLSEEPLPDALSWSELLAQRGELAFEPVPFDHPLYVLFSSGTTGLPKPIVHGHGGIVLEHFKQHALHNDLGPEDRFIWFSTTGWVMWNILVSGLLVGSSVLLFDGDPGHPDLGALWRMLGSEDITFFGTSAPFLLACRKAGLHPAAEADLSALRAVGSTGAPLPAEGFRWVYDELGDDVFLTSISGGTDVASAFVGGSPLLPVWAGEIAGPCLGCDVRAFDADGRSVVGELGELVVCEPMPSMPVGFWNDPSGERYRAAYFEEFPGVWRHGDWMLISERGSCLITGRSDATLNRGGVRLGTSEFYSTVEALPEIADSLVVHLEDSQGGVGELVLFVALAPGVELDDDLRARLARELRSALSPRHVPDTVHAVPAVPRTLSGKKLEVPVKDILRGRRADEVASRGALTDPDALEPFEALARGRGA
jgi:acetoacetyl-CoA synthetase